MEQYSKRRGATFSKIDPGELFVASINEVFRYCLRSNGDVDGIDDQSLVVLGPFVGDEPARPMLYDGSSLDRQAVVVLGDVEFSVPAGLEEQVMSDDSGNHSAGTVVLVGDEVFLKAILELDPRTAAAYVNVGSGAVVTGGRPGTHCVVNRWSIIARSNHADKPLWTFPDDTEQDDGQPASS